jgi:predicted type IV restriction endonuclease
MDIDTAFTTFSAIRQEFDLSSGDVKSEQDVRFRVINRVLTEVLGWEFKEISTERPNPSGFSDYLLTSFGRPRAILEAKRTSERLTSSKSSNLAFLNVGGPGLADAQAAVVQASLY